jgi:transcriptional regulator with XRE-family HTH domain
VVIGDRLRALREGKNLTQGDIEERTGLRRSYVSRVEHGHTIPAVETLERFARALEVPMYQLLYEGEEPPSLSNLPRRKTANDIAWGSEGKDARMLAKFCRLFSRTSESNLRLLFLMAEQMAQRNSARGR